MLDIILLGTGGTQPLPERALAAACITVGGSNLLLDCGEGTQTAARRAGVSIFRMDAILLTHYHGDHIFGLPGIWQTMAAQGRTAPLVMAGPPGLTDVVRTFYAVAGPLPFELRHLPPSKESITKYRTRETQSIPCTDDTLPPLEPEVVRRIRQHRQMRHNRLSAQERGRQFATEAGHGSDYPLFYSHHDYRRTESPGAGRHRHIARPSRLAGEYRRP